jgi:hypothetical protein
MSAMSELLDRDAFREAVLARSDGRCVACHAPATAAHHLIERALWHDGGYYVDNGVALCDRCHMEAENTRLGVEQLRLLAGIERVLVPAQLDPVVRYDKWGNTFSPEGYRILGPLAGRESMVRLLRRSGVIIV